MATSQFKTFTQADYDAIYAKLVAGEVDLLKDTDVKTQPRFQSLLLLLLSFNNTLRTVPFMGQSDFVLHKERSVMGEYIIEMLNITKDFPKIRPMTMLYCSLRKAKLCTAR